MLAVTDSNLDVELVARMAAGDRVALGSLYDRYASVLLATAFCILGDRQAAEDVVQDVFLEAWKKADAYDPSRAAVRTWLILRARSRSLDRLNAAPRRKTVYLDQLALPEVAGAVEARPGVEDADRLSEALAGLSAEQRQVLELAYFRGMSSSEIAQQVGIPTGTVKSRTRTALAALRGALGAREES